MLGAPEWCEGIVSGSLVYTVEPRYNVVVGIHDYGLHYTLGVRCSHLHQGAAKQQRSLAAAPGPGTMSKALCAGSTAMQYANMQFIELIK